MTLALDVDPEVYSALEDYRDSIRQKTGCNLTRSEAAVVLLRLMLEEKGLLKNKFQKGE